MGEGQLYLYVSESAELPTASNTDRSKLGTIYPEPFTAPLEMWAFSARVLAALAEHAWKPTQGGDQLNLVLTPALSDSEARVIRERDGFREVCVGLSPARWQRSSVADKRRLLVDIFVHQLGAVRDAWSLDWPALQHAATTMIEAYATLAAPVGDAAPVELGAKLTRMLHADLWSVAAPEKRLEIGREVAERTVATGRDLSRPELVTLPTGESVVRTVANGIPMVLVPHGRMRIGFDEGQLAHVDRVYRQIWSYWTKDEPQLKRSLLPFGADVTCQIDLRDEVEIPATWIAESSCDVDDEMPPWHVEHDEHGEHGDELPRFATWQRTLAFCGEHRMTLPTSAELLWAASAGDARLFPWGDDPGPIRDLVEGAAYEIAEAYGIENNPHTPHGPRNPFDVFAARNPFGIAAPLSYTTWCMPLADLGDPTPFVRVGGALDFYPWQGGWEAALFLTRVVSRSAFDGRVGRPRAVVRPIIRLG